MQPIPFTLQDLSKKMAQQQRAAMKEFAPYVRESYPQDAPTYTAQDLVSCERVGHERGYKEGIAAGIQQGKSAEAEFNKKLAILIEQMEEQFSLFFQTYQAIQETHITHTAKLAITIARKVLGDSQSVYALKQIQAMAEKAIAAMDAQAHIEIKIHPEMLAILTDMTQALAEKYGYQGKIKCIADDKVMLNNCEMRWCDGGANFYGADLWRNIEAILDETDLLPPTVDSSSVKLDVLETPEA